VRTHGRAARHALVSLLVVVIHYETMSIRYLGTICFCCVRFIIGASSVVVSRSRTYGAAAKLRASCECAHRTVLYSSDAGIKVSGHDPLWNYTDVLSSVNYFLETISMLFVK
jgi:hypothetical protein